jgi:hypothetical protein
MQGTRTRPNAGAGLLGWLAFIHEIKRYATSATHRTLSDYYLVALGLLLAGYAIFAKYFAYIGFAPVYVGEIVFSMGIIAFLKSRCAVATLATLPSLLLGFLFGWAIIRTLPYLGEFGADAMRDSAAVVYSGFAFIIAALLLEKPERLALIISYLCVVVGSIVVLAAPLLIMLSVMTTDVNIYIKITLLQLHLTGAALLMLLGFKRASIGLLIFLFIGIALASTQNRSGTFAMMMSLTLALILTGKWRKLAVIVVISAGLLGLLYSLDLSLPGKEREVSASQLVENLFSVVGTSDASNLEGTKDWRLSWWDAIFGYTFEGPYFWTGKGFGTNLAIADGFIKGKIPDTPLLRSPHSSHFTMLARMGVPGLALWLLTLVSWSAMLLVNMARARRFGDSTWADLFVLILCYELAFIIDSSFNVSVEGPHAGIWFWNLFGVGIGATMIYRASLRDRVARDANWLKRCPA